MPATDPAAPDVITVQEGGQNTTLVEGMLQTAGHRGLASAAEACEPDHTAVLAQEALLLGTGDCAFMPGDVRCLQSTPGQCPAM